MEFKDIKDVLTFAAFRPEADNPRFTWQQRFPKRKSVLVNISRGRCNWAFVNRKGQIESTAEADGEFIEGNLAVALPKPLVPPVIKATLPSKLAMM